MPACGPGAAPTGAYPADDRASACIPATSSTAVQDMLPRTCPQAHPDSAKPIREGPQIAWTSGIVGDMPSLDRDRPKVASAVSGPLVWWCCSSSWLGQGTGDHTDAASLALRLGLGAAAPAAHALRCRKGLPWPWCCCDSGPMQHQTECKGLPWLGAMLVQHQPPESSAIHSVWYVVCTADCHAAVAHAALDSTGLPCCRSCHCCLPPAAALHIPSHSHYLAEHSNPSFNDAGAARQPQVPHRHISPGQRHALAGEQCLEHSATATTACGRPVLPMRLACACPGTSRHCCKVLPAGCLPTCYPT